MALVDATCTHCGKNVLTNNKKDAAICPFCGQAFVTENAIQIYNNNNSTQSEELVKVKKIKRRNVWKSFGLGVLMVLECFLYFFYVIFGLWLFFDLHDALTKKKK